MSTRPICACCGKPYGQRTTHRETVTWPVGEPVPPYRGNKMVLKETEPEKTQKWKYPDHDYRDGYARTMQAVPDGEPYMHITRTLWDGETYWKSYEPFCTLRCALAYARRAYNKGVRL